MAPPPTTAAPALASEGARIWNVRKGKTGQPGATLSSGLRPQPSAPPAAAPAMVAAALQTISLQPESPSQPAPEAVVKPEVDELLEAGFELGQGTSTFGGRSNGRSGANREIQMSKDRIASLFDMYEEMELEGEEMGDPEQLKTDVAIMVMEFKKTAAKVTNALHLAHSELDGIAKRSDEADSSRTPEEHAALSILVEELMNMAGSQKQRLRHVHELSVEMLIVFLKSQLEAGKDDKIMRGEFERENVLMKQKIGRLEQEAVEREDREKKLQAEVFRLSETCSRQAEAIETKNKELEELREAKANFEATLAAAVQDRDSQIARLSHENGELREGLDVAKEHAAQTIEQLEAQVSDLQREVAEAREMAAQTEQLRQVETLLLGAELQQAEGKIKQMTQRITTLMKRADAGAAAQEREEMGRVGLNALRASLRQAEAELVAAVSTVKKARANEKVAVARAEAATQAMEEMATKLEVATQTLQQTQQKMETLEKETAEAAAASSSTAEADAEAARKAKAEADAAAEAARKAKAEADAAAAAAAATVAAAAAAAALPTDASAEAVKMKETLEMATQTIEELKAQLSDQNASEAEKLRELHGRHTRQVEAMQAEFDAALAAARAGGPGGLGETVVKVQLRVEQLLASVPQPGGLAALLEALREIDSRFADAIESALRDAKAQQLQAWMQTLRQPLSQLDEAMIAAWEQLWNMALAAGGEREAMMLQMQEEALERRRREEKEAERERVRKTEAAEAQRRLSDRQLEDSEGVGGSRRSQSAIDELEKRLRDEQEGAASLRKQMQAAMGASAEASQAAARALAEAEELRTALRTALDDLAAAQGGNTQELLARERALVASLREEVARQRAMRMGGMADKSAAALQAELDALVAQLARQEGAAAAARDELLGAWQEERASLLAQFEAEARSLKDEAAGLATRLREQHDQAEVEFKERVGKLKAALRDASGDGAAFDALEEEHTAALTATARRHAFEMSELEISAKADKGRVEAAVSRLTRRIGHSMRAVRAQVAGALGTTDAQPAEAATEADEAAEAARQRAAGKGTAAAAAAWRAASEAVVGGKSPAEAAVAAEAASDAAKRTIDAGKGALSAEAAGAAAAEAVCRGVAPEEAMAVGEAAAAAAEKAAREGKGAVAAAAAGKAAGEAAADAVAPAGGDAGPAAMAAADAAVAAMQRSCLDCMAASAQIAEGMARKAQLARVQAAELLRMAPPEAPPPIEGQSLPQLATSHAALLEATLAMLRLAPPPPPPGSRPRSGGARDPSPAGMVDHDPESEEFKEMAVEIVRQGQSLSRAAAAATHTQRREARGLQTVRRQLQQYQLNDRLAASLRQMESRYLAGLDRATSRREQLRLARTATLERGMQAMTTIIYHGSMFGELRSRYDATPVGETEALRAEKRAVAAARRAKTTPPGLVSPLAPHIASAIDMLQSVGPPAPGAPLAAFGSAADGRATVRKQRPGSSPGGRSELAVPLHMGGRSPAHSQPAAALAGGAARDGAQLLFKRNGSAPPGGRRAATQGSRPRTAPLRAPVSTPVSAPAERSRPRSPETLMGRPRSPPTTEQYGSILRPRSAVPTYSASQPQLGARSFAQPGPIPQGLAAGAGGAVGRSKPSPGEALYVRNLHPEARML